MEELSVRIDDRSSRLSSSAASRRIARIVGLGVLAVVAIAVPVWAHAVVMLRAELAASFITQAMAGGRAP
jgi:hypothetical protein